MIVDCQTRHRQLNEGQSQNENDHAGERTSDDRPDCDTEEYAGEFNSSVNTNDVPRMVRRDCRR